MPWGAHVPTAPPGMA